MNRQTRDLGPTIAYLAVCLFWGSTYLAMKIGATSSFPPELFAGVRFFIAGLLMLLFAKCTKKAFPSTFRDGVRAAVPGLLMLMCCNGLVMFAAQWVDSGVTSLLLCTVPLFVALIECVLLGSIRLKPSDWACLLVGFLGIVLTIASGRGLGSIDLRGGLFIVCGSMLWAAGSVYVKREKPSGSTVSHVSLQMLAAGAGLMIVSFFMGEFSHVVVTRGAIYSMIYLIIFGSIIGYSCNMYVLQVWPAAIAVTSSYINPIVAVILGILFLKEPVNLPILLAMGLTLGSVVVLHTLRYREARRNALHQGLEKTAAQEELPEEAGVKG